MSTAVAAPAPKAAVVPNGQKRTIKALLEGESFHQAIAKTLPKHLKPERFIRVALLAMQKTPKLAKCTEASFFNCLIQLSSLGLEPDGRLAHLIPFDNRKEGTTECTLIVDWKGLKELVLRTGLISYVHADVVCEGDLIEYNAGELKTHVPWFLRRDADKPAEEGDVFAAYALARMKDGSTQCVVMSTGEIEGIRQRSKSKDSGPWVTDLNEMRKKTVFRRLAKWLPMSPEIRDVVESGDDIIDIPGRNAKAKDTADAVPLSFAPQAALPEHNADDDVPMTYETAAPEPVPIQQAPAPAPRKQAAKPAPAPAPAPEPVDDDKPTINYIRAIALSLPAAGATEASLLAYLRTTGMIDESLSSLAEINMVRPAVLEHVHNAWADIVPHIAAKGAAK